HGRQGRPTRPQAGDPRVDAQPGAAVPVGAAGTARRLDGADRAGARDRVSRRGLRGGLLEDVYAAGGAEADDVRQTDLGSLDLAVAGLTAQVVAHLPDVRDAG